MNTALTPADTLPALAQQINGEHRQCEEAIGAAVQHAIRAGELLVEAKALCQHGEWLSWLGANFEGSERTAQAYMRVAREWPKLADGDPQRVADLSYREAVRLLAAPRELGPETPDDAEWEEIEREYLALRSEAQVLEARPNTPDLLPDLHAVIDHAGALQNRAAEFTLRTTRAAGKLLTEQQTRSDDFETYWIRQLVADGGLAALEKHISNARLSDLAQQVSARFGSGALRRYADEIGVSYRGLVSILAEGDYP